MSEPTRSVRPIQRRVHPSVPESLVRDLGQKGLAKLLADFSVLVSAEWSAAEERRVDALTHLEINGKD